MYLCEDVSKCVKMLPNICFKESLTELINPFEIMKPEVDEKSGKKAVNLSKKLSAAL